MKPKRQTKARKNEVVRDTTLTIRTTKRIKALAEIAALAQKPESLTLSNYLEQLIVSSFDHVLVDQQDEGKPGVGTVKMTAGRPLSEVADELYDDDDVTCLFKRLYRHSWALNREQYRLLKLINISPLLHPKASVYNEQAIRKHWNALNAVANGNAAIQTLPAGLFGNADIEFALMTEAEQVALYKANNDEFFRRSKTHLTKAKVK
jgi:hypothetical protein